MTFLEQQNDTLYYKLRVVSSDGDQVDVGLRLGQIFLLIDKNKEKLGIESFSLSQTTLEQVFLSLVKKYETVTRRPLLDNQTSPMKKPNSPKLQGTKNAGWSNENSSGKKGTGKARKKANTSREDDSYETDITLVSYRQSEESFFEDSRLSLRESFTEIKL